MTGSDDGPEVRTEFGEAVNMRPSGDIEDTTWRHSLMNWGHDPKKGD